MKNHEIQPPKLYETMEGQPDKIYPHVSLPTEVFEDHKCELNEEYKVTLIVRLDAMNNYQYEFKLLKSEVEETK